MSLSNKPSLHSGLFAANHGKHRTNPYSLEDRLRGLLLRGEKYAAKGIQYDPHDLPKNALLCFSLFTRIGRPLICVQRIDSIIYDFPVAVEYLPLSSLAEALRGAFEIPDKLVFINTSLASIHKPGIHANLIVINKKQRRIDVFDPLGKFADAEFREERELQEFIIREFMCEREEYYTLYDETEKVGIQVTDPRIKREGGGFCRIWVCLAAQLCAENPDKTLRQIVGVLTGKSGGGNATNICRGFLDEMRDGAVQMMGKKFSKLYLELREAPVQSGKAKSTYRFSEKRTMEYLKGLCVETLQRKTSAT
jgi:hypothetical protein